MWGCYHYSRGTPKNKNLNKRDPKKENGFTYRAACALCGWHLWHLVKGMSRRKPGRRHSEALKGSESEVPCSCLTHPCTLSQHHTQMLRPKVRVLWFYLPENPGTRGYLIQCSAARDCDQVRWIVKWQAAGGAADGCWKVTAADAEEEQGVRLSDPPGEDGALTASTPGEDQAQTKSL